MGSMHAAFCVLPETMVCCTPCSPAEFARSNRHGEAAMLLALDVGNTNTVLGLYRLTGEATESSRSLKW